ncbi:MAG: AlbA family DNA-binding domain-containing protein [Pseudonocardia sp.]
MLTVAAFLNTSGGTLLIGVTDDRTLIGLGHDYPHVKPHNGDGLVNWLTTLLSNAMGLRQPSGPARESSPATAWSCAAWTSQRPLDRYGPRREGPNGFSSSG